MFYKVCGRAVAAFLAVAAVAGSAGLSFQAINYMLEQFWNY